MSSEAQILKVVMDYLTMIEKQKKIYWFRSGAGSFQTASGRYFKTGRPGCPDVTALWQGRFYGVEVKDPTGRQSPAQKTAQAQIEASGGEYHIVRSLSDVKAIFSA